MAQIDPSIAMGFRPIQIESPINQMAAISQLEGARQQRQMNMLQMQEYARKAKEDQDLAAQQNELAKIHSSGVKIGSPDYFNLVAAKAPRLLTNIMDQQTKRDALEAQREAREAETEKRNFELGQKKEEVSRAKIKQAIADIANFDDLASIQSDIERKLTSGELTEEQANQIRSGLPADDSGIPAWQRNSLLKLMDLKDRVAEQQKAKERTAPKWELKKIGNREVLVDTNSFSPTVGQIKPGVEALVDTTPKPEKIEQNGRISFIDMNPNSATYGQPTGAMQEIVDTAPKWTARDIGGSIVYVDENQNSSTFGQQKEGTTLTKTATPTAPSKTVQLQAELVSAEKTYGKDSPQARQIRDKIEQETGGLERQRIAIDRYRSRKGEGNGSSTGPGPGTKLEKGERWNPDEQRIETVPGSKLYVAQSNAHGKDRSSLVAVETKTNSAIAKIDEILDPKNQDGFDANFSGMVPYGGFVTGRFAPDSRRRIESLKADMKSAGLELIRQGGSIGQITEREWPILEAMIAGISPEMTPEAARAEFKKVRAYMQKLKANAKDAYQTEWGDTQYFKPSSEDKASKQLSAEDREALAWAEAHPTDSRAIKIKKRLGVK